MGQVIKDNLQAREDDLRPLGGGDPEAVEEDPSGEAERERLRAEIRGDDSEGADGGEGAALRERSIVGDAKPGQTAGDEPEDGADSDEERVERARQKHEAIAAGDNRSREDAQNATDHALQDERAAAEDKPGGGEYGKQVTAPPAEDAGAE
jgi:hypothetical protein